MSTDPGYLVRFIPDDRNAYGKVADAEVHFSAGPFAGMRLLGFAVWQRRAGAGYNVTMPARTYSVNGERRSFALLRPGADADATARVTAWILDAWQRHQRGATQAQPEQPAGPTMAEIRATVAAGKPVAISAIIDAQRAEKAQQAARDASRPPRADMAGLPTLKTHAVQYNDAAATQPTRADVQRAQAALDLL